MEIDDWHCHGADTPRGVEEWCSEDRVVITRCGTWELELAGEARLADPTFTVCWNRETPYRVRHPVGGQDRCTVFRLTAAGRTALEALDRPRRRRSGPGLFDERTRLLDGPTHLVHRRVLAWARQGVPALAIEEGALTVLGRAVGAPAPRVSRGQRPMVDCALDIIARAFRRPLTVAEVAAQAGCSPFHLSHLVRRATGMSVYQRVLELRVREGLERLLETPDRLSAVALDLGFASHSHFTDAFRAKFGCSPSLARRQLGAGARRRPAGHA